MDSNSFDDLDLTDQEGGAKELVDKLRTEGKPIPIGLLQLVSNKPASELLAAGEAVFRLETTSDSSRKQIE